MTMSTNESKQEARDATEQYDPVHHTAGCNVPARDGTATERASKAIGQHCTISDEGDADASDIRPKGGEQPSQPLEPGVGKEAKESETKSQVPGKETEWSTKALDVGRDILQRFAPLNSVHEHVCGFHFYAHDMSRQVEAHHYCSHPSEEFRQCVLFDSDQPGSRLIGIEYIISERMFKELPDEEKKYWHSHRYEISSGTLIAPRVPGVAERQDMQKLAFTYGKTFHTWQVDRGDPVPLGPPQLMMAFTADGQLDEKLLRSRDARYGVDSTKKREERVGLNYPEDVDSGADHWLEGKAWQTKMENGPFKPLRPEQ